MTGSAARRSRRITSGIRDLVQWTISLIPITGTILYSSMYIGGF